MYNLISATELKQNTHQVIQTVLENKGEPVVISKYNQPQVVMIPYGEWLGIQSMRKPKLKKKTLYDRFKHLVSDWGPTDSVAMVREWRDD